MRGKHSLADAYDTDQIVIRWNGPHPVEINSEIRMPDMRLRSIQHFVRNDSYVTGERFENRKLLPVAFKNVAKVTALETLKTKNTIKVTTI